VNVVQNGFQGALKDSNKMIEKKIRVLVAKPGLDGHDRGAKVIVRALRDSGMEAIYTGLRQTPEQIVQAALQEDVDAIGVSILSGAHNYVMPRIMELIRENKMEDVLVFMGGIVPDQDQKPLKDIGVKGIFLPGSSLEEIVRFVKENVR
jgi:methylmalonyl-CoA mutase, C-terminal domain